MAVDPPDDAVETAASVVWIDDGIIHIRSKGTPSTDHTVTELVAAVRELIDGVPIPALFDLREWRKGDPEAWDTFISNALSLFSAAAFVVDPESSPQMGVYPEIIARLLIPFQVFTNEAEALAFLRGDAQNRGLPLVR